MQGSRKSVVGLRRRTAVVAGAAVVFGGMVKTVQADIIYSYDTTTAAGYASGAGAWDNGTTANFNTDGTGTTLVPYVNSTLANPTDAVFATAASGTGTFPAYTVVPAGSLVANTLTVNDSAQLFNLASTTKLSVGSIVFASPTSTIITPALRFGGGVTQTAGSTLTVNNTSLGLQFTNIFGATTIGTGGSLAENSTTNNTFASLTYNSAVASNILPNGTNVFTVTGPLNLNAGSIRLGSATGTLAINLGGTVTATTNFVLAGGNSSTSAYSPTIDFGGANRTFSVSPSATLSIDQTGDTGHFIIRNGAITKTGTGTLSLNTATNTYAGGTTVSAGGIALTDSAVTVTLSGVPTVTTNNATLGAGNVSLASGTTLTLNDTIATGTNQFIASGANLLLADSTPVVTLNYTGTDIINGLSLDGGMTYLTPGIYGSASNTTVGVTALSDFVGSGTLTVTSMVPEPGTLAAGSVVLAAGMLRRRRRNG